MIINLENKELKIYLEGRIDSQNAPYAEEEITAAADNNPDAIPVIDAEKLEYISSAGLRVLMRLRKRYGEPLRIYNVSPEVYEILSVTGFTEFMEVHKKLREVSIEGCKLIGEGANGKVYRFTKDEIIKVFRPGITLEAIEKEREASKNAFLLGVPCAISFDTVRCGDSYGTIFELINAATLSERIRENPASLPRYAESSARLMRQLHSLDAGSVGLPPASRILHSTLDAVAEYFTPEEVQLMRRIYDAIPEMNRFIHNDYHSKNIMESGGELVLIDLGDAGAGNPLIDLIHCYMVYNLIGSGGNKRSPDEMSFIGITYAEAERFWEIFSSTYCGSAEAASKLNKVIKPFAELMYLTVSMAYPIMPAEYKKIYADKVRTGVLPKAEEMISEIASLNL